MNASARSARIHVAKRHETGPTLWSWRPPRRWDWTFPHETMENWQGNKAIRSPGWGRERAVCGRQRLRNAWHKSHKENSSMSSRYLIALAVAAALASPIAANADVAPGQPKGDW